MTNEIHASAATSLDRIGLRYTKNRRTLVDVLVSAKAPLSIPEILAALPGSPQSSAYRNLTDLETAGVVSRVVSTDDWARFELDESVTGRHHHHLMCERCAMVFDVDIPEQLEHELDSTLEALAKKSGFRISHHRLDLVGRCKKCQ